MCQKAVVYSRAGAVPNKEREKEKRSHEIFRSQADGGIEKLYVFRRWCGMPYIGIQASAVHVADTLHDLLYLIVAPNLRTKFHLRV